MSAQLIFTVASNRSSLTPTVEALGFELWGVEYLSQGRHTLLRIYIESPDGITVDDAVNFIVPALEKAGISCFDVTQGSIVHSPDGITIETSVDTSFRAGMKFNYRIFKAADGKDLVKGFTKHAFVNEKGRIVRPPDFIKDVLDREAG